MTRRRKDVCLEDVQKSLAGCVQPRGGTQPQEEGKAREDEGGRSRGGGTGTKVVIGTTKVTAGCKTSEDKLEDLLWGENCF